MNPVRNRDHMYKIKNSYEIYNKTISRSEAFYGSLDRDLFLTG